MCCCGPTHVGPTASHEGAVELRASAVELLSATCTLSGPASMRPDAAEHVHAGEPHMLCSQHMMVPSYRHHISHQCYRTVGCMCMSPDGSTYTVQPSGLMLPECTATVMPSTGNLSVD